MFDTVIEIFTFQCNASALITIVYSLFPFNILLLIISTLLKFPEDEDQTDEDDEIEEPKKTKLKKMELSHNEVVEEPKVTRKTSKRKIKKGKLK